MLNVPRLDDMDYAALMERARAMIPTLTDEWTNYNSADPGITTLQAFAWLCDNLNYYLNATGEVHRLKYLKLLGIEPRRSPAQCRVALDSLQKGRIQVTKGTKLAAGDVVFEVEQSHQCDPNELVCLYQEQEAQVRDLTPFAGVDGDFAPCFSADGQVGSRLWFGFSHVLEGEVRFFVEIREVGRNPFDRDFSLSRLKWEFYGEEGFQEANLVEDETCGFLKSGFLSFSLKGSTKCWGDGEFLPAHYLRCTLEQNDYDRAPGIGRVLFSCVPVVQTDTDSQVLEYSYDGSGFVDIDYAVGEDWQILVAVEEEGSYVVWRQEMPDDLCDVKPGQRPWLYRVCFDRERYGVVPPLGAKVLVVVSNRERAGSFWLGITDGCANQELELDEGNLLELQIGLFETGESGRPRLTLWKQCDDLSLAGWDDPVFYHDSREQVIRFGDGIHGLQPKKGREVVLLTVKTSLLGEGNVLAGQVNRVLSPGREDLRVSNVEAAGGGTSMASSEELEVEIERQLKKVSRAVTQEDYQALVMATPGLLIDSVAVIPMREYSQSTGVPYQPNTVVVAVKPGADQPRPVLSEKYRQHIRRYLERYRLVTTDIAVVSAQYVGISVFGRIALTEDNARNRGYVLQQLEQMVDTVHTGDYGKRVDYGRLFSALEMLPCVKAVAQLSLEYIGSGGSKNAHGDILVDPDSLSYLNKTGLEFI